MEPVSGDTVPRFPWKRCFLKMLEHQEALQKILSAAPPLKTRLLPLQACLNLVLAKDLYSPLSLPGFDNSAMDGYALHTLGLTGETLNIQGEIRAGNRWKERIKKGHAIEVFTRACG